MLLLATYGLLSLLSIFTVYFYASRHRVFKDLRLDGPTPLPLVGNLLDFKNQIDILPVMLRYTQRYGKMMKVSVGTYHMTLVADCDVMSYIMNNAKFNEKGDHYRFLHRWLATGLLTSTGTKWTKRRKMLTPSFHFKILNNFVETFESVGDVLVKKLENYCDRGPVDVFNLITLYSLDIICETALGTSMNAQLDSESDYVVSVRKLLNLLAQRGMNALKNFDYFYVFTPDYWSNRAVTKNLHNYTNKIIRERREANITFNDDLEDEFGVKKKIAFLDLLIKSTIDGQPLSDEDIREEVDTFTFEGHDTTSTAISFGLYEIARNPDVQERIYREIVEVLGEDGTKHATYNDLQNMTYLEMVIKEVLRLYPSVPLFSRHIREDLIYEDRIFKAGSDVVLTPFLIHRQPDYFPNPDVFDPERFSPENSKSIKPFSYIPFSGGFRNCIGQRFAILDMKSAFSKIVRNYKLLPDPNYKPVLSYEVILKSANGVNIQIQRRH